MGRDTWIAVDWGTTHLRVWKMAAQEIVAVKASSRGMSGLEPQEFESAILELIESWLNDETGPVSALACGMVGARQGWIEAPYNNTPCPPVDVARAVEAPVRDTRFRLHVLPGLCQDVPADVLRGEETQIAGFLTENPDFDGLICLTGTHTKWVRVSAGMVEGFTTFMTGEVFSLLSGSSVLRHSVATDGWDADAFEIALLKVMAKPAALPAALFEIRADDLLHGFPSAVARARLSGLLVGSELAAMGSLKDQGDIALIGSAETVGVYQAACKIAGISVRVLDGETAVLAGLRAARTKMNLDGNAA